MKSPKLLDTDYIEDIRLASAKMYGTERRSFMAEMTLKHCEGNPRRAETVFGWSRTAVETGLGGKRTGIIRIGAKSARSGRIVREKKHPDAADALRQPADGHSQQDPAFRSTIAYTRLTAKAAVTALKEKEFADEQIPSCSNMAKIPDRMGYRLRNVLKSKPLKKTKRQMQFLTISKKKMMNQKTAGI